MRASTVGLLCSTALIACFVSRPTEDLKCSTNADCADLPGNRACESGYCVVPNCPSVCTSCDENAKTCQVDCIAGGDCGNITCPSGWNCAINCNATDACHDISCASGSKCTIACNASNACHNIACSSACQCDLTCAQGDCASFSCPVRGNGANQVRCTQDGTTATPCDSSRDASCTSC